MPKFSDASFVIDTGNRLIPTSEVPLVNLAAEKNIEGELPVRYTAATYCFRSEAGSAGRHTRGFIRLHQFSKVELHTESVTKGAWVNFACCRKTI